MISVSWEVIKKFQDENRFGAGEDEAMQNLVMHK